MTLGHRDKNDQTLPKTDLFVSEVQFFHQCHFLIYKNRKCVTGKANVFVSLFWVCFFKNVEGSHQKCYLLIDFDEKRNGFLLFLCLS